MNNDIIIKASGIVRLRFVRSNAMMNGTTQHWKLQSVCHEEWTAPGEMFVLEIFGAV